jgi:AAA15 family ATPase/GTPase
MAQLLSIKIKNYRSFYSEQELSFGDTSARNVTALYGPNSGGKSNTARALLTVLNIIQNSAEANAVLPYDPFLLRSGSDEEPSRFEIRYEYCGKYYTYVFSYDRERVIQEILYERSEKVNKRKIIFSRDKDGTMNPSANKYGFGRKLLSKTRSNTLLITKAREDNNKYSNGLFAVFDSLAVIPGDALNLHGLAIELLRRDPSLKERTIKLLRNSDFSIRDIIIEDIPVSEEMLAGLMLPDEIRQSIIQGGGTTVRTAHIVRDADRKAVGSKQFDLIGQESMGTKAFFEVAVPIVDALEYGKTLYIDEFGAYFHPMLADMIIGLFKSESNTESASLVLNTHSTSIMANGRLNREDIILVEKNLNEESVITPLTDKSVRQDENYEKRYRQGLYGGVPIIRERA